LQAAGPATQAALPTANNPQPDLQEGLGEPEIKAEPIRFVTCATGDLLQDAAFDVETWLFRKVSEGIRATINEAPLIGDGVGKPSSAFRSAM
jgi:HK97 family phage major capsid protein